MKHLQKLVGISLALTATASAVPASAETRGYVVSWFATATNLDKVDFKDNCPEDRNKGRVNQIKRDIMAVGYTEEEATKILSNSRDTIVLPPDVLKKVETRAVVNGQHVSIYNYPAATPDPNIETVSSKFAYGFDLGGKSPDAKFEDPETHQKVDNQFWRAVGCEWTFRAAYPIAPYSEEGTIAAMSESQLAWAIRISGDDLSKDGKVTVMLDRTTQHLENDANGEILRNVSYIIDSSPTYHNVFQGEIKNGVLSITPAQLRLKGGRYDEVNMRDTHMRITADGEKIGGFWGGYIKWLPVAFAFTSSPNGGYDTAGLYHALRKLADATPDPKTGQNTEISATFRMQAVPAYLLAADGTVLAKPAPRNAPELGKAAH